MSEVELHVVCKHCGAEVSPYITECPYCGNRLRKRAPKLESKGEEFTPKQSKSLFARLKRKPKPKSTADEQPLRWLSDARPAGTVALLVATAAVYVVDRTGSLGLFGLGSIVAPLDNDFWRLITSQFNYTNLGYLFAVGIATAIFGTSLERRYGLIAPVGIFLLSGAAGMYLATVVEVFPVAIGGNGSALGLIAAWSVREWRDRRAGWESDTDLMGVAVVAAVVAVMPLVDSFANWWVALGGIVVGALLGLMLPPRR